MNTVRRGVVALVALVLTGCTYDPGGSIYERAVTVRNEYRVLENGGVYASAATMHLANGCVEPYATLVFHLPTPDTPENRGFMASHYPPDVAEFFISLPTGSPPISMSGAGAIEMGATECRRGPPIPSP